MGVSNLVVLVTVLLLCAATFVLVGAFTISPAVGTIAVGVLLYLSAMYVNRLFVVGANGR